MANFNEVKAKVAAIDEKVAALTEVLTRVAADVAYAVSVISSGGPDGLTAAQTGELQDLLTSTDQTIAAVVAAAVEAEAKITPPVVVPPVE